MWNIFYNQSVVIHLQPPISFSGVHLKRFFLSFHIIMSPVRSDMPYHFRILNMHTDSSFNFCLNKTTDYVLEKQKKNLLWSGVIIIHFQIVWDGRSLSWCPVLFHPVYHAFSNPMSLHLFNGLPLRKILKFHSCHFFTHSWYLNEINESDIVWSSLTSLELSVKSDAVYVMRYCTELFGRMFQIFDPAPMSDADWFRRILAKGDVLMYVYLVPLRGSIVGRNLRILWHNILKII